VPQNNEVRQELEFEEMLALDRDVRPAVDQDVRPQLARDVRLELEFQDSEQVQNIYLI